MPWSLDISHTFENLKAETTTCFELKVFELFIMISAVPGEQLSKFTTLE